MAVTEPMTLSELPQEILQLIFSYIQDKSELLQFSLICRSFRLACLPSLYHTICIQKYHPHRYPDFERKFEGLVHSHNPGLRYVRRILLHHSSDFGFGIFGLDYFLERLLTAIPSDSLQAIGALDGCGGSCRCNLLCASNLALLSRTQRKVKEVFVDSTCLSMDDRETWSAIDSMASLKSVQNLKLCFHNHDLLPIYQLGCDLTRENITKIETLTICCGFQDDQDDQEPERTVLPRGFLTFGTSLQITLRRLKFFNFDFAEFDFDGFNNAFKYIEGLEDLEVNGCYRARSIISSVTPNRLKRLCVRHFEEPADAVLEALEYFLTSFDNSNSIGLSSLTVILDRAARLPRVDCIEAHGATLVELVLCARNRFGAFPRTFSASTQDLWPVRYKFDEVQSIYRSCTGLRQLSLSMEKEAGPDWYLTAMKPLKNLQTFLDVPWLHFDPHRAAADVINAPLVNPQPLLSTATRVFSLLDAVGVPLVVFSTSKVLAGRARRFYFVRDWTDCGSWYPRLVTKERLLADPNVECSIVNVGHHFRGETGTAGY